MTTKYIVNNLSGQTINGESVLPSYKVYTALLTQSGGDDPQTTTGGTLTIGVTYEITNIQSGDDFTNVGASSNNNGVKFVATNTTPNVWTNSSELSYNNGAPVTTILENTLGATITFEYILTGMYGLESLGTFTVGKTWVTFNYVDSNNQTIAYNGKNVNGFIIMTRNGGPSSDDVLNFSEIEIRVYN
jgi:hypothetical protein